ncbi:DUF4129 domain-containing protein [Bacillus sp. AK128]
MLNKDWHSYFLYLSIVAFEIISFYLLSTFVTDSLKPAELILIYLIPFAVVKMIQMNSGNDASTLYMAVPIIQAIGVYLVGYSLIVIALVLLFSCWRTYILIKEQYPDQQGVWLGVVLAATIAVLFMNRDFLLEYVGWFLVLLILFLFIRILLHVKENNWVLLKGSYRHLFFHILWVSAILVLLFQGGLYLLHTILPHVARVIGFIVGYPFTWLLDKLEIDLNGSGEEDANSEGELAEDDPLTRITQTGETSIEQIILPIIFIIIIGAVLLLLYLMRKKLMNLEEEKEGLVQVGAPDSKGVSFFQSLKDMGKGLYSPYGKNEVRIQFNKFQIFMKKRDLARKPAETVEEWFERLGLRDSVAADILKIYQQSRYSYSSISEQELKTFQQGMKNLKKRYADKK